MTSWGSIIPRGVPGRKWPLQFPFPSPILAKNLNQNNLNNWPFAKLVLPNLEVAFFILPDSRRSLLIYSKKTKEGNREWFESIILSKNPEIKKMQMWFQISKWGHLRVIIIKKYAMGGKSSKFSLFCFLAQAEIRTNCTAITHDLIPQLVWQWQSNLDL